MISCIFGHRGWILNPEKGQSRRRRNSELETLLTGAREVHLTHIHGYEIGLNVLLDWTVITARREENGRYGAKIQLVQIVNLWYILGATASVKRCGRVCSSICCMRMSLLKINVQTLCSRWAHSLKLYLTSIRGYKLEKFLYSISLSRNDLYSRKSYGSEGWTQIYTDIH